MTQDEIIAMAREAGFAISEDAKKYQPNCIIHTHHMIDEELKRFAALVEAKAAAKEREAIANLRHLYQNLVGGGVKNAAEAKRIAEGLLGPAIEALEMQQQSA